MAAPSLSYTLTNGSTADATQVMQNFNDLLNGYTDGTKDLSISALTCAGTATLNGNVNLGNSSSDDVTVTGSLASSIPVKTTNSYNIGSATHGLASIYFGANSQTVRLLPSGSMSATWTLTLPVSAGTNGHALQTNGSGVASWQPLQTDMHSVSSADYTVTDTDGYRTIAFVTGASNRTCTLPTAADNTDRILTLKKQDSGAGSLIVDGEGAETLLDYEGSATSITLAGQGDALTVQCNGTAWQVLSRSSMATSNAPGFRFLPQYIHDKAVTGITDNTFTTITDCEITLPASGTYILFYGATLRVESTVIPTYAEGSVKIQPSGSSDIQSVQVGLARAESLRNAGALASGVSYTASGATTIRLQARITVSGGNVSSRDARQAYIVAMRVV